MMQLFDVYPLFDIEPVKSKDVYLWDKDGTKYLDFYGGHAVISIGHGHPHYVEKITAQLRQIGFYSNSIINKLQIELAEKLGNISGYEDYHLFLCNSGAEAVENALKIATLSNGKKRILSFYKSFHGRTCGAVAVTDNENIKSIINKEHNVNFVPLNDIKKAEEVIEKRDISAVIIEGIQGIGGIHIPNKKFITALSQLCKEHKVILILDEIQSGYGRSGKFFAHQFADIRPDIITLAKGMANGFPIGAVLISPKFKAKYGMLGSTFGGNHLACTAAIAVLDVIKKDKLIPNALKMGKYLMDKLSEIKEIKEIRGSGLMIGIEFENSIKEIRQKLLFTHKIFTGVSGDKIIRLLPPLTISKDHVDYFIHSFKKAVR